MNKRKLVGACAALAMIFSFSACAKSGSADKDKDKASASTGAQWNGQAPTLTGSGKDIKLDFPDTDAPSDLQVWIQEEGTGKEVTSTDFVVARYVGQVWGKDQAFDSSFSRGAPTGFSLGGVIKGWTQALSGKKVGTSLIVSIPPELGYGSTGQQSAGISGTDVIDFYIEIVDAYSLDQAGQADAAVKTSTDDLPVEIKGDLGAAPELSIKSGAEEPKKLETIVLAEGSGEPVSDVQGTTVIVQYSMTYWDGSSQETTYAKRGPQSIPIQGTAISGLAGIRVGSRVLILSPSSDQSAQNTTQRTPAYALVVDILGQIPAEK